MLVHKRPRDWRDVEALAQLDTPRAREALKAALADSDAQVRAAVIDNAPNLIPDAERTRSTIEALGTAVFYEGLAQTLDQVEAFHPPGIVEALLKGATEPRGRSCVSFCGHALLPARQGTGTLRHGAAPVFSCASTPTTARRVRLCSSSCVSPLMSIQKSTWRQGRRTVESDGKGLIILSLRSLSPRSSNAPAHRQSRQGLPHPCDRCARARETNDRRFR